MPSSLEQTEQGGTVVAKGKQLLTPLGRAIVVRERPTKSPLGSVQVPEFVRYPRCRQRHPGGSEEMSQPGFAFHRARRLVRTP